MVQLCHGVIITYAIEMYFNDQSNDFVFSSSLSLPFIKLLKEYN